MEYDFGKRRSIPCPDCWWPSGHCPMNCGPSASKESDLLHYDWPKIIREIKMRLNFDDDEIALIEGALYEAHRARNKLGVDGYVSAKLDALLSRIKQWRQAVAEETVSG